MWMQVTLRLRGAEEIIAKIKLQELKLCSLRSAKLIRPSPDNRNSLQEHHGLYPSTSTPQTPGFTASAIIRSCHQLTPEGSHLTDTHSASAATVIGRDDLVLLNFHVVIGAHGSHHVESRSRASRSETPLVRALARVQLCREEYVAHIMMLYSWVIAPPCR